VSGVTFTANGAYHQSAPWRPVVLVTPQPALLALLAIVACGCARGAPTPTAGAGSTTATSTASSAAATWTAAGASSAAVLGPVATGKCRRHGGEPPPRVS
jgi:hypothetical protein